MVKVSLIDAEGEKHLIQADEGQSLMEVAYAHGVPGIIAECGGACACATCHVYVEPEWLVKLPQQDEIEETMLDTALKRNAKSRLSCQVILNPDLDGITVTVADNNF